MAGEIRDATFDRESASGTGCCRWQPRGTDSLTNCTCRDCPLPFVEPATVMSESNR